MKNLEKKQEIIEMLKNDDSYDLISLRTGISIQAIKKIEKNIKQKI